MFAIMRDQHMRVRMKLLKQAKTANYKVFDVYKL